MFWIVRKATEKLVGRGVSEDSLDLFLAVLPAGVYGIEDSDGNDINLAIVKRGRVEYRAGRPGVHRPRHNGLTWPCFAFTLCRNSPQSAPRTAKPFWSAVAAAGDPLTASCGLPHQAGMRK